MTGIARLASAAALAFATATVDAQEHAPRPAADSIVEVGHRDGRAAATTHSVGGYTALGVVTGFAAGAAGIPLLIFGDGGSRILGVAITIPVIWTVAATKARGAAPPPYVAQRIADQPAAYQEAFRAAYTQRLVQRRRRAATIGSVAGGVAGAAVLTALVAAVVASINY